MLVLIPTPAFETGYAGPTRGGRVRFEPTPLGVEFFALSESQTHGLSDLGAWGLRIGQHC